MPIAPHRHTAPGPGAQVRECLMDGWLTKTRATAWKINRQDRKFVLTAERLCYFKLKDGARSRRLR